jgi:hypothetical protein
VWCACPYRWICARLPLPCALPIPCALPFLWALSFPWKQRPIPRGGWCRGARTRGAVRALDSVSPIRGIFSQLCSLHVVGLVFVIYGCKLTGFCKWKSEFSLILKKDKSERVTRRRRTFGYSFALHFVSDSWSRISDRRRSHAETPNMNMQLWWGLTKSWIGRFSWRKKTGSFTSETDRFTVLTNL